MGKLMSLTELSSYLRVEKQTIYNWLHEKKISGIKVGHLWRFDRDEVDRWLKAKTVNAVSQKPQRRVKSGNR